MRDAERIEAQMGDISESESENCEQPEKQDSCEWLKPWRFQPGQSGNPNGRPKNDMAAQIARAIFENNPEMLYEAYAKALKKGSGFTFQVLSDRAYGKLKESLEVSGNLSLSERMEKARKRVKR